MANIKITLPDSSVREFESGTTGKDVARSIGSGLAKAAIGVVVDGEVKDLNFQINEDSRVEIVTPASDIGRDMLRHSSAHIMAQAVFDLFPGAKYAIGPAIEDGFYYDFELPGDQRFNEDDLARIEKRMSEIIKEDQPFVRGVCSIEQGTEKFNDQPFKLEIIEKVKAGANIEEDSADFSGGDEISYYENRKADGSVSYVDMCTGPHVPSTSYIKAFKLMRLAGAYWRGDEKRPMLQRIYGTAWEDKKALEDYLYMLEEAEKRDHRKIGEALDLFAFSAEVGKGLPLWLPKGTVIREELENWAKQTEREWGYERISTPHITREDLYYLSGHLPYYEEDLYSPMDIEGDNYYLKPMNCPHHHMVYKSRSHSYRELPLRYAEYGTVYRYEKSGQLFGLMRVRGFTQNDAHVYCSKEQAVDEFVDIMRLHDYYYRTLGIEDFYMVLALRDPKKKEKYHDDDQMWEEAERITREAIEKSGIRYVEDIGAAAHYGPKVDFILRSAIGKEFTASTNQVDLYMPSRFNLTFKNKNGEDETPVVQHRAPLGSHERFVGFLIEHYAGAFPVWLAPVQVVVAPVADRHYEYADQVHRRLFALGIRSELHDSETDSLGSRIRKAKTEKVPYILVVGDEDVQSNSVGVNKRGDEKPQRGVNVDAFIDNVVEKIKTKSLEV
ncbi:MAG: threonine--tRNA ligase [Acidimicrobiia bacterium]